MTPMTDLIEAALELGYRVLSVSERHITLVRVDGSQVTNITLESSWLSPDVLRSVLRAVSDA